MQRSCALTRRSVLRDGGLGLTAMLAGRSAEAAGSRTYVVGSTASGVPFSFVDMRTSHLTGAMIDIIEAIAKEAGFAIELRITSFAALIPSLQSKKIDIISAAMLKTPARQKVVDFSVPVFSYGAGIVVPARDTKDYRRIEDLRGMVAGVQAGTRFLDQLQLAGAKEIKTYDTLMDMLLDLSTRRIEVAYGDAPILKYEMAQARMRAARFVSGFRPPGVEDVCLVVRKGEGELLGRINAAVSRIQATEIQSAVKRWSLS